MISATHYLSKGRTMFDAIVAAYGHPNPREPEDLRPLKDAVARLRQHIIADSPDLMHHRETRNDPLMSWSAVTPMDQQIKVATLLGL